jgi:hypothetical protein
VLKRILPGCAVIALGLWSGGCAADSETGAGLGGAGSVLPSAQLTVVGPTYALTPLAVEAVALAPAWLVADLRANLVGLGAPLQDELAALMTEIEDPRALDEVAFTIAHMSPEHLAHQDFRSQIIVDNVTALFAIDEAVAYADIVDFDVGHGGGTTDGYFSTITYRTMADGENVEQLTMAKEFYYWYVMFPVIEDERATYIVPDTGQPGEPPTGRFWRDYLFWEADDGYQPLSTYLTGQDVLWKGTAYDKDDNGAVGNVIQWVQDVMVFGSGSERPVQPVRIYAKHLGRCGEHSDITSAAARAALIPNVNLAAWANDHVWNEFYDDRWVQWEPVNTYVEHNYYYADADKNYHRSGLGVDNDCDGVVDEGCDLADPTADSDEDGVTRGDGDCNDSNEDIYPGAPETPDGRDNDCDGVADDGAETADADQDGVTLAGGDCNDWDNTSYPGASETAADGVDNDCDGTADDGTDVSDGDGDGQTIFDGDCNDGDSAMWLGAAEIADGKDNNCNGTADEGVATVDGDGDGYTIAAGDCNDRGAAIHPGAAEVTPSNNRNFAVSAWRGDGKVWTVTDRYAGTFTLDVQVTDTAGAPVDGATVMIAGWSTTYAANPGIKIATWSVTDLDGRASFQLGEANKYYGRVESTAGNFPLEDNKVTELFDDPVKGEVRSWAPEIDAVIGSRQSETVDDLPPSLWSLELEYDFQTGFYTGTNYFTDQSYREPAAGTADLYVVDEANLAALMTGGPFVSLVVAEASTAGVLSVPMPAAGGPWYVVAAAPVNLSGIVDGRLAVSALHGGDLRAVETLALPLVHGDLVAVRFEPGL